MNNMKFLVKYLNKNKRSVFLIFVLLVSLSVLNILPGLIIRNIFDKGIVNKDIAYIILLSAILLVIYIIITLLNYKSTYIMSKCSQTIITSIREDIIKQALNMPMAFFDSQESGYVTARINEVSNLSTLFSIGNFKALVSVFEFIGACIILLGMNWKLTLICLTLTPVAFLITQKNFLKLKKVSQSTIEQGALLNNSIQQTIQGIEEIKNLASEKKENIKISQENNKLLEYTIMQSKRFACMTQEITFVSLLSNVVLLLAGSLFVITSNLTIGTYLTFSNYLGKLYAPIQSLSIMFSTLPPALVTLNRLNSFFKDYEEISNNIPTESIQHIEKIQFDNVSFKYPNKKGFVFENLSFTINQTDKVFISGQNGSGKTTIFRLLLGLYSYEFGKIEINRKNITTFSQSELRKHFSIVSQKMYLFRGTIEENIRYGIDISDEEYSKRMNSLELNGFLSQMNISDDLVVLENGKNLSGGQIQRIAIVRGLCRNADVYLFDEITSHLDTKTKIYLEKIIKNNFNSKICIFIGHDRDMQMYCNKFIDLDKI